MESDGEYSDSVFFSNKRSRIKFELFVCTRLVYMETSVRRCIVDVIRFRRTIFKLIAVDDR